MARMRRWSGAAAALLVAASSFVACGEDPTDTDLTVVAFVVTPNPIQLVQRDSVLLVVTAQTASGASVPVSFTFASANPAVATVSATGRVRSADLLGTTGITISGGGVTVQIGATVAQRVASIVVTPNPISLITRAAVNLVAQARDVVNVPVAGVTFIYASSDTTRATVNSVGRVTARDSAGTAQVTVTAGGVSTQVPVTVMDSSYIAATTMLSDTPYGVAITSGGVAFITLLFAAQAARETLPAQTFGTRIPVGSVPTDVTFNNAGTRAYVANQFSQSISVIDVATNGTLPAISVSGDPFKVIVAPGDSILWVTTNRDSVYAIRLATGAVITRFATSGATAMGFAARDSLLWVATRAGGTVIEINMKTYTVVRTISLGGLTQDLVLSSNGQELYVANENGSVQFITLATGAFTSLTLPGGGGFGMARRSNKNLLYVTSSYVTTSGIGVIHVVDPVTRTVVQTIQAGGTPRRVAFNASGSIGIVANEGGWVDFLK